MIYYNMYVAGNFFAAFQSDHEARQAVNDYNMLHELQNATLIVSNSNVRVTLGEEIKGYFVIFRKGYGKFSNMYVINNRKLIFWSSNGNREPFIFTSYHAARAMAMTVGGRVEKATSQDVKGIYDGLAR